MKVDKERNYFSLPFAIKTFSFCGALFKRILAWEEAFPEHG